MTWGKRLYFSSSMRKPSALIYKMSSQPWALLELSRIFAEKSRLFLLVSCKTEHYTNRFPRKSTFATTNKPYLSWNILFIVQHLIRFHAFLLRVFGQISHRHPQANLVCDCFLPWFYQTPQKVRLLLLFSISAEVWDIWPLAVSEECEKDWHPEPHRSPHNSNDERDISGHSERVTSL